MFNVFSPLRYPDGKTQLFPVIFNLLSFNSLLNGTYIEPFAGGAGLAIKLLLKNVVNRIIINDVDPAIYAIWYNIINYTDKFCSFIEKASLTIQEWEYHRYIYITIIQISSNWDAPHFI